MLTVPTAYHTTVGTASTSVFFYVERGCKKEGTSIILVHNHPSGDPDPSRQDISVTRKLVKSGKIMDIPVVDHVIIGEKRYCSMKKLGYIR
ncbi:JAB domain-containing protein [Selenomonas ruminantium]|uniref:JAB domain-containing protein n=1 Tax=Selenomonas ruminantium TaxID=971 RepID=UPI00093467E3|nr:JAB domain-containing protein [Selenomonas ruminantium]